MGVPSRVDGPDFQRGRVNAKMDLAPLTTLVGSMLLCLPLAFAEHLDAGTVDQQVQSRRRRLRPDCHCQMLLAPTYRAEVGHLPLQAGSLSRLCAMPIAWRSARLNRLLIVRQNWIAPRCTQLVES